MKRVIISGGGTGGHIFPAIAIANALRQANADIEILFVGAEGRMEMERVPAAGYNIVGLPIMGINRRLTLKNLQVPVKLYRSLRRAALVIGDFKPDVVIGVGGYASAPTLLAAQWRGIPTLIQEQNSYAGVSNKILARRAKTVCVAYDGMERFFAKEKIVMTGNPVRQFTINEVNTSKSTKTILVVGGSLGARTINESISGGRDKIAANPDIHWIWQTGKRYAAAAGALPDNITVHPFIEDMDAAYAAADLVISRAGAGTISELCVVGKPCILVPSPNVAEDHQTKNAMALVRKGAAMMTADSDARATLVDTALALVRDEVRLNLLAVGVKKCALPNAAADIAAAALLLIYS
jgi:UDP-N-acetylglucosamine--N-acetylmuramyl-(pentapeptide) pyrophosphoryl-undecaprenol N-acetylglucosamine transferase